MTIRPEQFSKVTGDYEAYVNDTTSSWPIGRDSGRAGNVSQRIMVEPTENGRWGGFIHSARYDTDRAGNIDVMHDADDETRMDTARTRSGRSSFRTPGRAAAVAHANASVIARQHAEHRPDY